MARAASRRSSRPGRKPTVPCPRCASPVVDAADSLGRLHCPACGHTWSIKPVAKTRRGTDRVTKPKGQKQQGQKPPNRDRRRAARVAPVVGAEASGQRPSRGGALFQNERDLIGRDVGGCRVERFLGKGGYGWVYLARQLRLDRKVALKVLPPSLPGNARQIEQLESEARILARVNHPNILQVYDLGVMEGAGSYYMVMEWVDGRDLNEILDGKGPLPATTVLDIVRQAACGLQAANQQGIIHRDIKPQNLMYSRDGVCKVTDFGLATLATQAQTPSGEFRYGTAAFMSPEQSTNQAVDCRGDMYSLGCTAYMALTGHPPFEKESPYAMIIAHRTEPPPGLRTHIPDADPYLDNLLARMMAKRPQERFQDMAGMIQAVDRVIAKLRETRSKADESTTDSWLFD